MAILTLDEIRRKMLHETPVQWCIYLGLVERRLKETGFTTLREFVETTIDKGGLGIPLVKAKEFLDFNPAYRHKAAELKARLDQKDDDYRRNVGIHAQRQQGKTQQQIANEVGLSRRRVGEVLAGKPVMTQKTAKPRILSVYQINSGTKPETAAAKIVEKFGMGFAKSLKACLP